MSLPTSLEIWAQTIEALCWQQISAFILAERGVRKTRLFLSGEFQPACFRRMAQLALNHYGTQIFRGSWGSGELVAGSWFLLLVTFCIWIFTLLFFLKITIFFHFFFLKCFRFSPRLWPSVELGQRLWCSSHTEGQWSVEKWMWGAGVLTLSSACFELLSNEGYGQRII